ncbi:hypothetical protein B0A48_01314 [Cryoendolithus antarcticus]|uniref:Uncharacterized protein n=1 Tax=Cryoendolithus antarcticus TaxID=1507870 RepID=A0A1V8TT08_9PEZI|nr:hypothetical protein B0A48_01314 [Cryoendolithus antarcticus]
MPGKTIFTAMNLKKEPPNIHPAQQWSDHSTTSKPARVHLGHQGQVHATVVEVGHDDDPILPKQDRADDKAKGGKAKKLLRKLLPIAGLSVGLASLGVHIAEFVEALN